MAWYRITQYNYRGKLPEVNTPFSKGKAHAPAVSAISNWIQSFDISFILLLAMRMKLENNISTDKTSNN